jgi:hypothetical protein
MKTFKIYKNSKGEFILQLPLIKKHKGYLVVFLSKYLKEYEISRKTIKEIVTNLNAIIIHRK